MGWPNGETWGLLPCQPLLGVSLVKVSLTWVVGEVGLPATLPHSYIFSFFFSVCQNATKKSWVPFNWLSPVIISQITTGQCTAAQLHSWES